MDIFKSLISFVHANLALLSSLLVPLIAIITVYIAYQQHKTNKNRLKFELYNKRYEVYVCVKTFISHVVSISDIDTNTALKFLRETREAEFLFDNEIIEYINELYKKALEVHAIVATYEPLPAGEQRGELIDKQFKLIEWFISQPEIASEKFRKYLSLKDLN